MIQIFRCSNLVPFSLNLSPGEVFGNGGVFTLSVFTLSGVDCIVVDNRIALSCENFRILRFDLIKW